MPAFFFYFQVHIYNKQFETFLITCNVCTDETACSLKEKRAFQAWGAAFVIDVMLCTAWAVVSSVNILSVGDALGHYVLSLVLLWKEPRAA